MTDFDFIDQEIARGTRAIHPDKVKLHKRRARAIAVLHMLNGLPFSEAAEVLDAAEALLDMDRQRLLERSVFSPESSTPTDSEDRPS